jgi:hypothetical protein
MALGTIVAVNWMVRRSPSRWGRPAAALLLFSLLGSSALNSGQMVKGFVDLGPVLTTDSLRNARLAIDIPAGAHVFVYAPAATYGDLVKAATVAYFLPDRSVRIYAGDMRIGTFLDQDVEPPFCAFDYVVAADQPQGEFVEVDADIGNGFSVFQHTGDPCPLTG